MLMFSTPGHKPTQTATSNDFVSIEEVQACAGSLRELPVTTEDKTMKLHAVVGNRKGIAARY